MGNDNDDLDLFVDDDEMGEDTNSNDDLDLFVDEEEHEQEPEPEVQRPRRNLRSNLFTDTTNRDVNANVFSENVNTGGHAQNLPVSGGNTELQNTEQGNAETSELAETQTEVQEVTEVQAENATQEVTKKKSKLKPALIMAGFLLVAGVGGVGAYNKISGGGSPSQEYMPVAYENTGCYALDQFKELVVKYDKLGLDKYLGGTSYISQEWDYTNSNELRQNFIKSMCSYFDITYPDGSDMTGGENCIITVVDYAKLASTMEEDKDTIREMYLKSGYKETDYDFQYNMTNLMIDYILSKNNLPTKNIEVNIPLKSSAEASTDAEGNAVYLDSYVVQDDIAVDKALFSSDDLHSMFDKFAVIAVDWKDTKKGKVEYYADNPEYKKWAGKLDKVKKYYEEKGKKYPDETKLYQYDSKTMKLKKDKKGNYIEVKKPNEKVIKVKTGDVANPYVSETYIPYTWLGAYYCQFEYNGEGGVRAQYGNGTKDAPAGVGTEVITKAIDIYGIAHDVKITLTGYWVGKDAVDYAVSFSEKNRGLSGDSIVTLICYEVMIENLEDKDITIESDMFLADESGNQSSKTGNMFGFKSGSVIPAHQSVVLQDWATSTEMAKKYVVWGKSFNRRYDLVWFNLLAGDKSNEGKADEDLQSDTNGSAVTQYDPTPVPEETPVPVSSQPYETAVPQDNTVTETAQPVQEETVGTEMTEQPQEAVMTDTPQENIDQPLTTQEAQELDSIGQDINELKHEEQGTSLDGIE